MRISTFQLHQQALHSMQKQTAKVQKSEMQIASGLKFLKPSDDPVGAVKVLNLNSNLGMVEQYGRNVAQAQSALGYQESILVSVNDALQRIRELTLQANNPANHDSALRSIGQEIDEHLQSLKLLANTRDAAGEYIFGGFRVDEPPFAEVSGTMVYNGDQGQRMVQIGEGAQVAVRDPGDAIFMNVRVGTVPGSTAPPTPARLDMFTMVGDIAAALQAAGTSPAAQASRQQALAQGIANLDQALDGVSNQRAAVGNRLAHIDSIDNLNQDFRLQLDTVLSATQDLDYAEAISSFNLQLTSLQAAQQAYMKTSELSLFRYL